MNKTKYRVFKVIKDKRYKLKTTYHKVIGGLSIIDVYYRLL